MATDQLKLQVILDTINKASAPLKAIDRDSGATARALKSTRDQLKQLQAQQRDITSFKKLQEATQKSGEALEAQQQKVADLARQLKATDNPTKSLQRQFDRATASAKKLKTSHQGNRDQLHQLGNQLSQSGVKTNNLNRHQDLLAMQMKRANQQIDQQKAKLAQLGEQQQKLNAIRAKSDQIQKTAMKTALYSGAAAYGGSRALGGMAGMAQDGLSFDQTMSRVQALTRLDKDSDTLKMLREQARELGASTSFTAQDAAQGQGFLAMAGFTPDAIKSAMPGMLSLAKAAGEELGATADIGSNILTGFKLKSDQMGRAGDVLTATFTRSNTNLQMLGDTMKYVGPVVSGLGGTLEEAAAMAGKLGDAGIQGSMAGTAMRAIYSRLAKPPKMAAYAIAELGLETQDAAGNLRSMPELLAEISEITKDIGNAERAGIFKQIAGEEAFSALQVLVDQAGSGDLQAMITDLNNAQGTALNTARDMADNATGDLQSLASAWSDVKIELFETNNGPLRDTIQSITSVVRGISAWTKAHPELAAFLVKMAVILGVLVTTMGALGLATSTVMFGWAGLLRLAPLLGLFKGLAALLPILSGGFTALGAAIMATPVGWLLAAIAAIAGGGYLIYKNWEPIKLFFSDLWLEIKEAFAGGIAGVAALLINWSPIGLLYKGIRKGIAMLGVELPETLTKAGSQLLGMDKPENKVASAGRMSKRIKQATAGVVMTTATAGTAAFDKSPPLQSKAPASVNQLTVEGISIHPSPGMDEMALAKLVGQEIDKRQRAMAAGNRSRLRDED